MTAAPQHDLVEICRVLQEQNSELTRPRRILVVEDDGPTRALIDRLTSRHNCTVEFADSVKAGEEKVRANGFDLIFCDLRLPGGSGLDIFREMKRSHPRHAPMVFLSAYVNADAVEEAAQVGFSVWVRKPNDFRQDFFNELLRAFGIQTKEEVTTNPIQ